MQHVIFHRPGEPEISLLADLAARSDSVVCAVIDPQGDSPGTPMAEVLGLLVASGAAAVGAPAGSLLVSGSFALPDDVAAEAGLRGWRIVDAAEVPGLLSAPTSGAVAAKPLGGGESGIEAVLAGIELGLDRKAVLQRLLDLAIAEAKAERGALLLPDPGGAEFVVAASRGKLCDIGTRVALGEGPAGRAARDRRSEMSSRAPAPGSGHVAACTQLAIPLLRGRRVGGVLLLEQDAGADGLAGTAVGAFDRISGRFGRILDSLAQSAPLGSRLQSLDLALRTALDAERDGGILLGQWAGIIGRACAVDEAELTVLRNDGTALSAGTMAAPAGSDSAGSDRIWRRVIATGKPLYSRDFAASPMDCGSSLVHLPIGETPVLGVLALKVDAACDVSRFLIRSRPLLEVLRDRLLDLRELMRRRDRLGRLDALARFLALPAAACPSHEERLRQIRDEACRLTGAISAFIVGADPDGVADVDDLPDDPLWREAAVRLLERCRPRGWRASVLDPALGDRRGEDCLLAAVTAPGEDGPGLILFGKQRLHAFDDACFTDLDGEIAGRLCGVLRRSTSGSSDVVPAVSTVAVAGPDAAPPDSDRDLLELIRREMDRSDRYHVSFSLSLFRPRISDWDGGGAARAVADIYGLIRTSDQVMVLSDYSLALLAPEETQAVSRLEKRIIALLQQIHQDPELIVATGRVVYPGPIDSAEMLLQSAREALAS